MILWLMEQTVLLTLVCAVMLSAHKLLLKLLGAHHKYALWLAVPLLLLSSLLVQFIPDLLAQTKLTSLSNYRVIAGDALAQTQSIASDSLLLSFWSAGITIMLTLAALQSHYLRKLVRNSNSFTQSRAEKAAPIQCRLPIVQQAEIASPMLAGLIKPTIIVPVDFNRLAAGQQKAVIAHELYHNSRGDIAVNLFAYGILALFWFNPVCWLAYRRFRDDQELACDAQITSSMQTDEKMAYSHALLAYSQHARQGMLHTHYGNKHILKERILQMKKQHGKSPLAVLGMTLGLGLSGLMLNQQVQAGDHGADKSHENNIHPVIRVEPRYPKAAAKANQNGYVQLKFDINESGTVSNIKVIKSSPTGVFDESAVEALQQWTYKASTHGATGAMVQLDFIIDEPETHIERIKVTSGKS